ncbi:hypothetical protein NEOC65_001114 [Neochlamydia sp. AcF65]|nr:hypothetical protein [Neochlamydia sp. AcF65]NGY94459.1 hypothetical protein [Neochlamydia sp. AcF84]
MREGEGVKNNLYRLSKAFFCFSIKILLTFAFLLAGFLYKMGSFRNKLFQTFFLRIILEGTMLYSKIAKT